jgi:NADPH-dependent glutamate synthase beta subunit-like oxidoreductase/NAD(P)H-flavin reductase
VVVAYINHDNGNNGGIMSALSLAFGLEFGDLYERDGLVKVDAAFLAHMVAADGDLSARLSAARAASDDQDDSETAQLMVDLAPHVEDFVAVLFAIEGEVQALAATHNELAPLYTCKRLFVQRRAAKRIKADEAAGFDIAVIEASLEALLGAAVDEIGFATAVMGWLDDEAAHGEALEKALQFAAWATLTPDGRARFGHGILFKVPRKPDPERLVPVETTQMHGHHMLGLPAEGLRRRDGFALTDEGMDLTVALDQANYCIFCHNQGKDSCRKGLRDRDGMFRPSPFGVTLTGCPLEERVSELNLVKSQGHSIGALAIVTVDNPMAAATGHRICNDCMKACIYQKQDPVDIPQVETRTLKDVLALPWGFEIYSLLTRWNPLDFSRPLPRPDSGRKVLVVGLGPAGFNLAHHLMNDGHGVVGIDGLKIEALPGEVSGVDVSGERTAFEPVRDVEALFESLDNRVMAGFGGVAEYGITVRWNKNYLKLVRLLLERRAQFAMFGGIRFGGTITAEDAFALGFDHIALAVGAGKPTVLPIPNGLVRGVRAASDFLMALQLTGAAKTDSIANMQLRLPVVVIGGGLTAIDTATESLAYYPVQVEKFLARYDALVALRGDDAVRAGWDDEEREIADEFVTHARAIRAERAAAEAEGREARVLELLDGWGGVTIAYRKRLIDSPSYTLNHEEVEKALEEGIHFDECLSPVAVDVDSRGHARAIRLNRQQHVRDGDGWITLDAIESLPARSVLVAAGTQPNTVLGREYPDYYALDGRYFQAVDEDGSPVTPERIAKPQDVRVLASVRDDGRSLSFFGDVHPSFAGNVVKAMASAKQGYPVVSRMLGRVEPASGATNGDFMTGLNRDLRATVHAVNRLTPTILEVVVRAPTAARAFRPGQFYRLQNFETRAPRVNGTALAMEGMAMTGAWTDPDQGLLGLIVLEMGGSSDICAVLEPGEPVVVMGPTGMPTEIPAGETVLLAGGGLGNAVLFSIGRALREAGSKVLYFAGYKKLEDRYKVADIEAAADVVVWACDEAPGFTPERPGDLTYAGTIIDAIAAYGEGALGDAPIALGDVDRIITIGSDRMMAALTAARHGVLVAHLKPGHQAIGSINSPMQCMMKEICAQCLQTHRDPDTGLEFVVFSCFNQDQPLDSVDFDGLASRLRQNSVQEKLTAQWVDHCLTTLNHRPVAK